jgi:Tol biopolymer transport system component
MSGAHQEFTLEARTLGGRARTILKLPARIRVFDVARDGAVLLAVDDERFSILGQGPGDRQERELSYLDLSWVCDISADGRSILFNDFRDSTAYAALQRATDGSGAPVRIGEGRNPVLSADGKWVVTTQLTQPRRIMLLPTGAGEPRPVSAEGLESLHEVDWFPDGRRVLIWGNEPGGKVRLFESDIATGKRRALTPEGIRYVSHPVSPDGRWVAGETAAGQVVLFPTDGGAPRTLSALAPGEVPIRWAADGRALYILERGTLPARVFLFDMASGRRTLWKDLIPADRAGVMFIATVQVAAGAQAYAYSFKRVLGQLHVMRGLR